VIPEHMMRGVDFVVLTVPLRARYHDENTKLEDLTHPEDIEHFKKHEQMEEEEERIEAMSKQSIVLENIPAKFRRPI